MLVKEYPGPRSKEQTIPNRGWEGERDGGTFESRSCSTGPAHYDNQNQSRAMSPVVIIGHRRGRGKGRGAKFKEQDRRKGPKKFQNDTVFFSASSLQ